MSGGSPNSSALCQKLVDKTKKLSEANLLITNLQSKIDSLETELVLSQNEVAGNSELLDELQDLKSENIDLSSEKTELLAENNDLLSEKEKLVAQNNDLLSEKKELVFKLQSLESKNIDDDEKKKLMVTIQNLEQDVYRLRQKNGILEYIMSSKQDVLEKIAHGFNELSSTFFQYYHSEQPNAFAIPNSTQSSIDFPGDPFAIPNSTQSSMDLPRNSLAIPTMPSISSKPVGFDISKVVETKSGKNIPSKKRARPHSKDDVPTRKKQKKGETKNKYFRQKFKESCSSLIESTSWHLRKNVTCHVCCQTKSSQQYLNCYGCRTLFCKRCIYHIVHDEEKRSIDPSRRLVDLKYCPKCQSKCTCSKCST